VLNTSNPASPWTNTVTKKVIEIEYLLTLDGHMDEVLCIKFSKEHSILVSGSADSTCIIWDTNRRRLVRSLTPHYGPIIGLDIHPYNGEIAVIDDRGKDTGSIYLWSINGDLITNKRCKPRANCVVFTSIKPGLGSNLVVTGHSNGDLKLWSALDLTLLHTISGVHKSSVNAISIRNDNKQMISADNAGICMVHDFKL